VSQCRSGFVAAVVVYALTFGVPALFREPWALSRATANSSGSGDANPDENVTTHHQMKRGERTLRYTARAGMLPIRDNETGEIHGRMFFIAYGLDRSPGEPARPLTFLWNGGPGANSTLLHLSGFGPRRIHRSPDQGGSTHEVLEIEDNQTTWLDQTDLVFVDPIGTGFSRPTRAEYAAEFYNTLGDIASVTEFVRVYLTRFDAWDAPLVICGESYGVWRAAGVAEALVRRGRTVAGVILISGGIPVGPVLSDAMRTALFVPTRTAAAFYHKKLAPELLTDERATLAKAETWARTEYAPALAKRDSLGPSERQRIREQLARFTGLDPSLIDEKTLVVGRQAFAEQLLRDRKQVLARYDIREFASSAGIWSAGQKRAISKYLRAELGFKTDLAYQGVEEGFSPSTGGRPLSVGERWNYNQGPPQPRGTPPNADAPPGGHQPWLRRAIALAPSLRAFVAAGWYDSLNSCAGNAYLIKQLEPELQRSITAKSYAGGHMLYESPGARQQLRQDIKQFLEDICRADRSGGGRPRPP
jgi:carboxypeptidase C (cathepsin A)